MQPASFCGKQTVTLFLTVLEVAAPVFLIAAIGFAWVKAEYDYPVEFVTRLGVLLATPCLIFTALVETQIDPAALADLSLATLAVYAAITLACWALIKAGRLDRRTFLAPVIFGNTGNLGLPLVLFAFGDIGLGYGVVVFGIMSVWAFTFGIWLVSGGIALTRLAREPMVVATVAGAIFLWQGWGLPTVAANTLGLIGQMAIPLMLLTLGVAVAQLKPAGLGRAVLAEPRQSADLCGARLWRWIAVSARPGGLGRSGAASRDARGRHLLPFGRALSGRCEIRGGPCRRLDADVHRRNPAIARPFVITGRKTIFSAANLQYCLDKTNIKSSSEADQCAIA